MLGQLRMSIPKQLGLWLVSSIIGLTASSMTWAQPAGSGFMSGQELLEGLRGGEFRLQEPTNVARIVAPVREAARGDAIEVGNRACTKWVTIDTSAIIRTSRAPLAPVDCPEGSYLVLSVEVYADSVSDRMGEFEREGEFDPPIVVYFKKQWGRGIVSSLNAILGGGFGETPEQCEAQLQECYLDCQFPGNPRSDFYGDDVDACFALCDALFDACMYDPFTLGPQ